MDYDDEKCPNRYTTCLASLGPDLTWQRKRCVGPSLDDESSKTEQSTMDEGA